MKNYMVVYEENGCDVFAGNYEECERYIEDIQVKENGMSREEFGIYEA